MKIHIIILEMIWKYINWCVRLSWARSHFL